MVDVNTCLLGRVCVCTGWCFFQRLTLFFFQIHHRFSSMWRDEAECRHGAQEGQSAIICAYDQCMLMPNPTLGVFLWALTRCGTYGVFSTPSHWTDNLLLSLSPNSRSSHLDFWSLCPHSNNQNWKNGVKGPKQAGKLATVLEGKTTTFYMSGLSEFHCKKLPWHRWKQWIRTVWICELERFQETKSGWFKGIF